MPLTKKDKLQILLKEYEKAQDSAEHHSSTIWIATSVLFTGVLILTGSLLQVDYAKSITKWLVGPVGLFVIILCISLLVFLKCAEFKKGIKYQKCHEIEELTQKIIEGTKTIDDYKGMKANLLIEKKYKPCVSPMCLLKAIIVLMIALWSFIIIIIFYKFFI